ncbi:hypothetical protein BD779DRAFT_637495 [Infundibulicybe gibba]|nr:hypothetical protein BD779DRAFT_637495 [Infundibulicybe gibba]
MKRTDDLANWATLLSCRWNWDNCQDVMNSMPLNCECPGWSLGSKLGEHDQRQWQLHRVFWHRRQPDPSRNSGASGADSFALKAATSGFIGVLKRTPTPRAIIAPKLRGWRFKRSSLSPHAVFEASVRLNYVFLNTLLGGYVIATTPPNTRPTE